MYVAISKDLINRVENRITNMRKQEVAASCPNITAGKNVSMDVSALFTIGCWGEHAHLLHAIPKEEWCKKVESADIHVDGATMVGDQEVRATAGIRFTDLTNAWGMPQVDSWYCNTNCRFNVDDLRALPDLAGKKELLDMYDEAVIQAEINHRWTKIQMEMVGFLNKCKSLNEAVKLFPGVKLYVDKHDIERLERKVERAPREEVVVNLDTEGITASAIALKLMSAA